MKDIKHKGSCFSDHDIYLHQSSL